VDGVVDLIQKNWCGVSTFSGMIWGGVENDVQHMKLILFEKNIR